MDQDIYSNTKATGAAAKLQPEMGIHLTDAAVAETRRRMTQESDAEKKMLRLRVGAGGCSGLSYEMEFVAAGDA
ncbi:MAG: hypothetical protein E4G91_08080, partial [Candidatus Zixiibacteriota bacterium]